MTKLTRQNIEKYKNSLGAIRLMELINDCIYESLTENQIEYIKEIESTYPIRSGQIAAVILANVRRIE